MNMFDEHSNGSASFSATNAPAQEDIPNTKSTAKQHPVNFVVVVLPVFGVLVAVVLFAGAMGFQTPMDFLANALGGWFFNVVSARNYINAAYWLLLWSGLIIMLGYFVGKNTK